MLPLSPNRCSQENGLKRNLQTDAITLGFSCKVDMDSTLRTKIGINVPLLAFIESSISQNELNYSL